MDKTIKVILSFAFFAILLLGGVAAFNFYADPMCYYRCDSIEVQRPTQNVYYEAAQLIAANPDSEVIILGSSRGQTTPEVWVQSRTGMKTLNLSKGGAGVLLKLALLRIAQEYKLPLKKVIWIADYFEVAGEVTDVKVRQTPVLRRYLTQELSEIGGLKNRFESLQRLIDHNSFEASLAQKSLTQTFEIPQSGVDIDYQACASPDFKGKTPAEVLSKEVDISYSTFGPTLRSRLNNSYVEALRQSVQMLAQDGVEVLILVPPFHPDFMARLAKDAPDSLKLHQQWFDYLNSLQSDRIRVSSFWNGIPGDDEGPAFWDDGAHPTCKSMMIMLDKAL
ncbi:hypothetical protein [Bdellovibrio sp. BCCA]|uniref:hypothetical protein n=1 Tax=Bdellovibrio sp. BCCA TaxID=3136281 RepID=UPI0030F0323E